MTAALGNTLNALQVACEELNRRGCSARMREVRYCGERDHRLLVRRPEGPATVELLAPLEERDGDPWQAVRVSGGQRTVWCGPLRAGVVSGLDLVPFVLDMLSAGDTVLAQRYRRCDPA